ncbi:hypothetical protein BDR26DRAFT_914334 [Obelidium mucronatum]|nr:hypothetical protein BDR26DRAFT_914334 [Obelidium mucronatum]
MAPSVLFFEVVGTGSCAHLAEQAIAVEAGWDTEAIITGSVLLKTATKLKSARIQAELRGFCETRWETNIKLATKPESSSYKISQSGRVFCQLVEVVYEGTIDITTGERMSLPFTFKLPRNGLPPTFSSVAGSVQYYIKCSMLYQEPLKLLKTSVDFEIPVMVRMPEAAKMALLQSPSQMAHQVAASAEKIGYSVQIAKRILAIGDQLEVNIMIQSTPEGTRLRSMNASLRPVASYANKDNYGAHAVFPRPLSETAETFPLVQVDSNEPVTRKLFLHIDPEIALASFESALISVKTIFRLQVTLDNSETPNVVWEVPVVVVAQPLAKTRARSLSEPPAVKQFAPSVQEQEDQYLHYQILQEQRYQLQAQQAQQYQQLFHQQQQYQLRQYQSQFEQLPVAPYPFQSPGLQRHASQQFQPVGLHRQRSQGQMGFPRVPSQASMAPPVNSYSTTTSYSTSNVVPSRNPRSDSFNALRNPSISHAPLVGRARTIAGTTTTPAISPSPTLTPSISSNSNLQAGATIDSKLKGLLAELDALQYATNPAATEEGRSSTSTGRTMDSDTSSTPTYYGRTAVLSPTAESTVATESN